MELAWRGTVSTTRLEDLLRSAGQELAGDRPLDALRFSDAAFRLAPDNRAVVLLHTGILIRCDEVARALEVLAPWLEGGSLSPLLAARKMEALLKVQRHADAAAWAVEIIARISVDPDSGLAPWLNRLCELDPQKYPGWVAWDRTLHLHATVLPGLTPRLRLADAAVIMPQRQPGDSSSRLQRFDFSGPQLDALRLAGEPLQVVCANRQLLGSPLRAPKDYGASGWVMADEHRLRGRVRLSGMSSQAATLRIVRTDAAAASAETVTLECRDATDREGEYLIAADRRSLPAADFSVHAVLPSGESVPLLDAPVPILPRASIHPITILPPRSLPSEADSRTTPAIVDIVIPVYDAREATLRCLRSVLATVTLDEAEVVVVDDGSTDAELKLALAQLAAAGRITLKTRSHNSGFPAAANDGMRLHSDRDVVLLNSDCEVYGNWLGRLRNAAGTASDIASVTPMGSNASIVSYPLSENAQQAPSPSMRPQMIDAISSVVNAGRLVEIPVGVGFCLYLKRNCINEIGYFDEVNFGRGYGEENDWCLRARRSGWRHVAATNVYISHSGGASFSGESDLRRERNAEVLETLHPGFNAMVLQFLQSNPLNAARRAIDEEKLRRQVTERPIWLISLAIGGGVQNAVNQSAERLLALGRTVLEISPLVDLQTYGAHTDDAGKCAPATCQGVRIRLRGARAVVLDYAMEELPVALRLLKEMTPLSIEWHHFLDLPADIFSMIADCTSPLDVVLHDYSWICPRLTLVGGSGRYCGEPHVDSCESCIRLNGSLLSYPPTVTELRSRSERILAKARRICCANDDVRSRYLQYFPLLSIDVEPWEQLPHLNPPTKGVLADPIRVAVIGAISAQKGFHVLRDCAKAAHDQQLPLQFHLVGYSADDDALLNTGRIFISGAYRDEGVQELLALQGCQVALFASVVPETWSFALSHALRAGLPIVAFDHGAFYSRLHGNPRARLLPLESSPNDINRALIELAEANYAPRSTKESDAEVATLTDPSDAVIAPTIPSVQFVTLPQGIYTFSRSDQTLIDDGNAAGAVAASLHVGLAPERSAATVDFFCGRDTHDRWIKAISDRITVRVRGEEDARLLLTSLKSPDHQPLSIDVHRLDVPLPPDSSSAANLRVMLHVRELGDLHYNNGQVGRIAPGIWIEAFTASYVNGTGVNMLEYKGLTADGFETPWLSDEILCGSRGRQTPLSGFAVRLRPEYRTEYFCQYRGLFSNGNTSTLHADGDLCRAVEGVDTLEGIEIQIRART